MRTANPSVLHRKLALQAEKSQNISGIFTNSIDIFENSTDIFTNFKDILSLFGTAAENQARRRSVDSAAEPKPLRSVPTMEAQPKNIKKWHIHQ